MLPNENGLGEVFSEVFITWHTSARRQEKSSDDRCVQSGMHMQATAVPVPVWVLYAQLVINLEKYETQMENIGKMEREERNEPVVVRGNLSGKKKESNITIL